MCHLRMSSAIGRQYCILYTVLNTKEYTYRHSGYRIAYTEYALPLVTHYSTSPPTNVVNGGDFLVPAHVSTGYSGGRRGTGETAHSRHKLLVGAWTCTPVS